MKKKSSLLLLSSVFAMLAVFLVLPGSAFAATTPSQAPDTAFSAQLAVLQKMCRVVYVHLDGAKHTAACAQVQNKSTHAGAVSPYTGRYSCDSGIITMYIYNNTGELCFTGGGYLAVQIYHVTYVYSNAGTFGTSWFRWYGVGVYTNVDPGNSVAFDSPGVYVTQICPACGAH